MAQFKKARIDEASSSTPQTAASERLQPCGSNRISDSLFMLYEPAPPRINSIDIIFFHGLQFGRNSDAHLSTWRSGDAMQEVWPERWLPAKYPGARILSASYDAFVGTTGTEGMMDMHLIGENLLSEILWVRSQVEGCPVILVGHSFGGLVIKQLCLSADKNRETHANGQDIRKFLGDIRGIFFYATPHRGMNTAVLSQDIVLNSMPANAQLLSFVDLLGKESARLHDVFEKQWKEHKWLIYGVGELHAMEGRSNLLVEEASSRFGDKYISVEYNHLSLCRHVSKRSSGYLHLVELIDKIYDQRRKDERRNHEHIFTNVMGLESLVAEVQELLKEHTFLGFCGMGGVGKTTIAKLVFKTLSARFEYTCFVSEVKLIQGNKEEIKKKIWENMHHHNHRSIPTMADVRGSKLLIVFDDIDKWEHAELLQEMADDNASAESRFITTSRDAGVLKQLKGKYYVYPVQILKPQLARKLFIAHAFPEQRERLECLEPYVEKVVKGCQGLPLTLEVLGKYLRRRTNVRFWDDTLDALRNAEALDTLEERVWRKVRMSYDALDGIEKHMFLDIASFLLLGGCPFSLLEVRTAWSFMFRCVDIRWETLVERSLIQEESTHLSHMNERLVIDNFGSKLSYGDEVRIVRMHEHLRSMGQRIAKETGRCFSMMDSPCGGNTIHPEKIVAVRVDFSLPSDGDVDGSCDGSCSPCKVQKFFSQLKGVRYLDLDNRRSLPCERCRTSGGFSLPRGLVMFGWRGSNVNVQLPLEASVCTSLAVLRLDRDDDCSLDILSPQACGYLSSLERLTMSGSCIIRLPHTFGSLSSLKHMEITGCHQLRRLPETFGNLRCLTDLKLVECSVLEGLPETFGNLSSLERLELQWCSGLERLPESFGNLGRSLKHLEIDNCRKLERLPETFGNLSSLERLELRGCYGLERLPESFGNLGRSLKHLEIVICGKLEGLPETFGNLSSLERLELQGCEGLERLPETFGNLSSLERLELQRCVGLERLPESFGNLGRSLKHLQIFDCEKLEGLPETFGNLSSLERLELQWCRRLERLPESFGNLGRSLKHLEIDNCRKLEGLPETFGNLSSLERLELQWCKGLERLPESFGNLGRSLRHLEIDNCRKLEGLPETFGNLSSLERLELQWCKGLERLPESFGNLGRSLKHLEIDNCRKLEGLPETFGNLSSLERLKVEWCLGLQRLPESFGNLGRSLKHLEIDDCWKFKWLPETFGNLSILERLELRCCYGLERLPESFGNLGRSLKHLEIRSCIWLKGLPETFGDLSSLERLELQGCEGLERLPETFGNLSSLERLELRCCYGLERLPESFGNLGRSLKHLEIVNCRKLEGLPETFGNLSSLERLKVEWCLGLERLPESFGKLGRSLKHLEIIACPKLEVPWTIRKWNSLKRLDIN